MTYFKRHILKILTAAFLGVCLLPSSSRAQNFGDYPGSCQSECNNSTCELQFNSNGILPNKCPSGTRYDVDPNCIMNQNAQSGSCLDTMPVASISRVSETNCYRANGAGGNSKPRNHKGTDYATAAGTVVTAAADGVIKSALNIGGGGRALIIEHEKKCQCKVGGQGGSCDNKFATVYLHLSGYIKTSGSVKRGEPIAYVGGSNYNSSTGVLCDAGQPKDGCKPYGPHLHFEIHSIRFGKDYNYSSLNSTSIVNPLCDDIQTFCGGCSYDVQKCQGKTSTNEWEDLSAEAAQDKSEASASGSMSPQPAGGDTGDSFAFAGETGCPLEKFLPDSDTCWFCPLFRVLFNTASRVALNAYTALAGGVAMLVIMAFALWIAVYVLKHVSAIEVKQPSKMIQELLLQAFKVLLVVLILKVSFFQVVGLTLEPVFNTGLTFTQILTGQGSCSDGAEYMQNIVGYDKEFTQSSDGGLPRSMGKGIICTIKSIQDSVDRMYAYGRQSWCLGWKDQAFIKYIIPSFPFLITGLMLMAGAMVLLLAFPWCLIDCVLQMAIASALAPAAIGAWAFKATARYLKMIWDFFMNAMFNFVFLTIIIYIIMTVVDQFMNSLEQYAASTGDAWTIFVDPINGLAYWGVTGLKLVVVCFLGWVFLDEGKSFADSYAKAADVGSIGRSVGGMFAQAGQKMSSVAGKAGKKLGKAGGQVADRFVGSRIRKAQNNYRINKVKKNGSAIKDKDGNIVGYERTSRNLLGQKVTRTVSIDKDGKQVWSKTRKSLIGNGYVRITSGSAITKRERLDNSGNVIHEDFKFRGASGAHLTNKDGTINTDRVNDLVKNSGLSQEDVMKAVGTEVMKQRGGQFDSYFKSRNVTFDKNGNMHMVQINEDGSQTELNMAIGGKNGNQMITEFIHTQNDGSYSVLYSNGIQNKNVSYRAGEAQAKVSYSFADEYYRRHRFTKPLNAQGRFGKKMDIDMAMYGFDRNDHTMHTAQVASGRAQDTGAVYTSKIV